MQTTLDKIAVGGTCKVVRLLAQGATRRRLLDMGVTVNTEIYVRKTAPFGDPLELLLRGYELTMRKAEASLIVVETEDTEKEGEVTA